MSSDGGAVVTEGVPGTMVGAEGRAFGLVTCVLKATLRQAEARRRDRSCLREGAGDLNWC